MTPEKKVPPRATLEEIQAFCVEQGLEVRDGTYCYWHWDENEWTISGKPIKKWRSAIMAWKLQGYLPSQREKFRARRNLPSASEVRNVIRRHRDRVQGLREAETEEAWERIFRMELQCSYADAMKVLE